MYGETGNSQFTKNTYLKFERGGLNMSIITGKEILKPYLKKTTGYIKSLLSAQHVEMDDGKSLQTAVDEIYNNLMPTAWTKLGTCAGLTCYYKYNSFMCQVRVVGSLDGSMFIAWHPYPIGTLPTQCRPSELLYSDMSGDTLLFEVAANGVVSITSRAPLTGSSTYWNATITYFII